MVTSTLLPASYGLGLPAVACTTVGWACLIWYVTVVIVCALGYFQIWRYFLLRPKISHSSTSPSAPHVTVIRPVKDLEPNLYDCLASTFFQDYPRDKITIYLCIASRDDPAYPTLQKLVKDFSHTHDMRVFIEDEDPLLQPGNAAGYSLGPNPKIRNMSRAYREAKGDLLWIIDCNVWVGQGVCGRMVDRLCGFGSRSRKRYKFVHHLPIAVDVTGAEESLAPGAAATIDYGGGRLEELFLSSAHAKMYTAINTVLIAPCIVGKSNMFRRSHLDYLTTALRDGTGSRSPGIDFFSDNICEDHLIGDLLWKNRVREEAELGEHWGKHAMVFGDLAIQPVSDMSVSSYIARRIRWLRVRKFTVLLATLVEPGTESFICSLYGAWGATTALAELLRNRGFCTGGQLSTWPAFFCVFVSSVIIWTLADWTLYIKLHSAKTIELGEHTPQFAQPILGARTTRRPFLHWFAAWLGREILALPIWICAVYGGVTVSWRDRQFKVGLDAKVREIKSGPGQLEDSYTTSYQTDRVVCRRVDR